MKLNTVFGFSEHFREMKVLIKKPVFRKQQDKFSMIYQF